MTPMLAAFDWTWPVALAAGLTGGAAAAALFLRRPSAAPSAPANPDHAQIAEHIVDRSDTAVLYLDSSGVVCGSNAAARNLLGVAITDQRPHPFLDLVGESDRALFASDWARLQQGSPLSTEYHLRRTSGPDLTVELNAIPLASGRIALLIRDISATRVTADSLRRSHRQCTAALDAVPVPLAVIDRSGIVVEFNRAWREAQERSGWPFGLLRAAAIFDQSVLAPDDAAGIARVISGAQSSATTLASSRAPGDADPPYRLHATNAFDPGAGVAIILAEGPGFNLEPDSSDDRRFLAKILETTAALIVVLDLSGRIVRFNDACTRLTGYAPAEVLGKPFWDVVIAPEDREHVRAEFSRAVSTGDIRPFENAWVAKDGRRFTILWSGSILSGPAGASTVISTGIDVTEARRLQQEIVQAQRMEAIGQLAGGIAHDFNNLLTAIFGHTALAKRLIPESHEAAASLDRVQQAAEQAGRVIRSLLTFSTKERSEKAPVAVRALFDELANLVEGLLPANVQLTVLPVAESLWIQADRLQIQQAILNLAINARDAMPSGGALRLSASPTSDRASVDIILEDSGQGIPKELLPRVFEPFFSTKAKTSGGGLGLSVARSIVSDHNGSLNLSSEVGVGTRVTLTLPVCTPPTVDAPATVESPGTRLLIASHRPYPRQIMVSTLYSLGLPIEALADSEALAREIVSAPQGSIVAVCDATLLSQQPHIIKSATDRNVPILALGDPTALAALANPAITTLAEPFTTAQLLTTTRRLIESRSVNPILSSTHT